MNLICCPPSFNEVLIINRKDIIIVYSLNNFFLIFSMLKFINIYRAIFHLSPLNKLIYKTICNSKMVKMDLLFMIRYFLNRYPITFIIINFFIFGTIFCILIYSIEYFSLDIKNGYWNNKGYNNLKNFNNTIYLYLFFIIKNEFGDIRPKSELGIFIMIIVGTLSSLVVSYFVTFMLKLINLSTYEERAFTKVTRMLDPVKKEHKSANLIKYFILARQVFKDNKNFEKDYAINKSKKSKNKTTKSNQKSYKKLVFNLEDIYNNYVLFRENDRNKRKFIYYLCQKFILKIKILNESKIFNDDFKIARNLSHSFADLLKTLEHRIKENLNQLNAKLQVIIFKEELYKRFLIFHNKNIKKIKKLSSYQNEIIDYLINRHNAINYEDHLSLSERKKQKETKSGTVLYSDKNIHVKMKKFTHIIIPSKFFYNKVKSSIINSSRLSNLGIIYEKTSENIHNQNHIHMNSIVDKRKINKVKSLNNYSLHSMNKLKKTINYV